MDYGTSYEKDVMIDYKFYYAGPLIFKTKLSQVDLESIRFLCKKDKKKDYRKRLAGHIDHEYLIDNIKIQSILNKYLDAHKHAYEQFYAKPYPGKINCKTAWVNYMKSGETNPVHTHTNCDFSSVIFLDIPKGLKEENKKFIGTSVGPGSLNFDICAVSDHYIDSVVVIPEIGDFYIFPWNLKHSVSSFKSKGERISVACNFDFKKD
jgi:uncharacterized protein (TIGR02466 family)